MRAGIRTADDIAVICCYFNPSKYATKRENYEVFSEAVRRRGKLFTIECAFRKAPFELDRKTGVIQVRSRFVMWQKERLLNLLLITLPKRYSKIAWVDCDLLFENDNWLFETSRALDRMAVVQPFELAVRLPRGQVADTGEGQRYEGYGAIFARDPLSAEGLRPSHRHGHTGFAWAARRDVLGHGLYDACISGNGDHLMAHAFAGNWETRCFERHFADSPEYWAHFEAWCRSMYPAVRAQIGFVPGKILHLWHGEQEQRRYMDRNRELNAFAFKPAEDLRIGYQGCYEWSSRKPDLHRWADRYFGARYEDGSTNVALADRSLLIDRVNRARDRACSEGHSLRLAELIRSIRAASSVEDAMVIANSGLGTGLEE